MRLQFACLIRTLELRPLGANFVLNVALVAPYRVRATPEVLNDDVPEDLDDDVPEDLDDDVLEDLDDDALEDLDDVSEALDRMVVVVAALCLVVALFLWPTQRVVPPASCLLSILPLSK